MLSPLSYGPIIDDYLEPHPQEICPEPPQVPQVLCRPPLARMKPLPSHAAHLVYPLPRQFGHTGFLSATCWFLLVSCFDRGKRNARGHLFGVRGRTWLTPIFRHMFATSEMRCSTLSYTHRGACRTRTGHLRLAKAAFYQMN